MPLKSLRVVGADVVAAQRIGSAGRKGRVRAATDDNAMALEMLQAMPVLSGFDNAQIRMLFDNLVEHDFAPGEFIVQAGRTSSACYVITKGEAVVLQNKERNGRRGSVDIGRLRSGAIIGERNLRDGDPSPQTSSIRAIKPTRCLKLTKQACERVTNSNFGTEQQIKDQFVSKMAELPIFQGLSDLDKEKVRDRMVVTHFHTGDYICREADKGKEFFVIHEGKCSIFSTKTKQKVMGTLVPGSFFGERALMNDDNIRTASVVAETPVTCLALARMDFKRIQKDLASVMIQQAALQRRNVDTQTNERSSKTKKNYRRKFSLNTDFSMRPTTLTAAKSEQGDVVIGVQRAISAFKKRMTKVQDKAEDYDVRKQPGIIDTFPALAMNKLNLTGSSVDVSRIAELVRSILSKRRRDRSEEDIAFLKTFTKRVYFWKNKCASWNPIKCGQLCARMRFKHVPQGTQLHKEGSTGNEVNIILSGAVRMTRLLGEKEVTEAVLLAGDSFGETAIMGMHLRVNSAYAETALDMISFLDQDFKKISGSLEVDVKRQFLKSTKLFDDYDDYKLYNLATKFQEHHATPWSRVVQAGKESAGLYFVYEGTAMMLHGKGKDKTPLRTECEADSLMDAGAVFGESSLLNYAARATSDVPSSRYSEGQQKLETSTVAVHGTGALLLVLRPDSYDKIEPSCVEALQRLRQQRMEWRQAQAQKVERISKSMFEMKDSQDPRKSVRRMHAGRPGAAALLQPEEQEEGQEGQGAEDKGKHKGKGRDKGKEGGQGKDYGVEASTAAPAVGFEFEPLPSDPIQLEQFVLAKHNTLLNFDERCDRASGKADKRGKAGPNPSSSLLGGGAGAGSSMGGSMGGSKSLPALARPRFSAMSRSSVSSYRSTSSVGTNRSTWSRASQLSHRRDRVQRRRRRVVRTSEGAKFHLPSTGSSSSSLPGISLSSLAPPIIAPPNPPAPPYELPPYELGSVSSVTATDFGDPDTARTMSSTFVTEVSLADYESDVAADACADASARAHAAGLQYGPLVETVIGAEQDLGRQCDSLDGMLEETAALSEEINDVLCRIRKREGGICSSEMSINALLRSAQPTPLRTVDRRKWK